MPPFLLFSNIAHTSIPSRSQMYQCLLQPLCLPCLLFCAQTWSLYSCGMKCQLHVFLSPLKKPCDSYYPFQVTFPQNKTDFNYSALKKNWMKITWTRSHLRETHIWFPKKCISNIQESDKPYAISSIKTQIFYF